MSRITNPNLIAVLLVLPAGAAAPRKVPLATYSTLWTQSPFTVKPVIEQTDREEVNPFEDWALGGVSGASGNKIVILFHRKEANKQMIVDSGDPSAEFKIVEIKQDPDDYKKTEVVISGSGKTGTVTYDDKLLATRTAAKGKAAAQAKMKAAMAAKAASAKKAMPGAAASRQPRMRVIPQPKKK